jgi:hypothetical protein
VGDVRLLVVDQELIAELLDDQLIRARSVDVA